MKRMIIMMMITLLSVFDVSAAWPSGSITNTYGDYTIVYLGLDDPADLTKFNDNFTNMMMQIRSMNTDAAFPLSNSLSMFTNSLTQIDDLRGVGTNSYTTNFNYNGYNFIQNDTNLWTVIANNMTTGTANAAEIANIVSTQEVLTAAVGYNSTTGAANLVAINLNADTNAAQATAIDNNADTNAANTASISALDTNVFKISESNTAADGTTNTFYALQCKGISPIASILSTQTITAASTILMTNMVLSITSAADVEITNAPSLQLATKAPLHTLRGIHNEGDYTITIPSTNTVAGSGYCGETDLDLPAGAFCMLLWHSDVSCWNLATSPQITGSGDNITSYRNNSGVTIEQGWPLKATGYTGGKKTAALADCNTYPTNGAVAIALDDLVNNRNGVAMYRGLIEGVDTSDDGDLIAGTTYDGCEIWLNTNGAPQPYTVTRPTATDAGVQFCGYVVYDNANVGQILFIPDNYHNTPNEIVLRNAMDADGNDINDVQDLSVLGNMSVASNVTATGEMSAEGTNVIDAILANMATNVSNAGAIYNLSTFVANAVTTNGEQTIAIASNTTHRTSDGTDHSYIDQDVTSGAAPTFDADNFSNLPMFYTWEVVGATNSYPHWHMFNQAFTLTNCFVQSSGCTGVVQLVVKSLTADHYTSTNIHTEIELDADGTAVTSFNTNSIGAGEMLGIIFKELSGFEATNNCRVHIQGWL